MNLPVPMGVIRAAVPSLLIAHDAQDARRTRLQHINNNHPGATAKHSQPPCLCLTATAAFTRQDHRAINVINHSQVGCSTVTGEHKFRSSDVVTARFVQIPERIVQVRFPSPASIAFAHAGALPP
jgi:hypothetical protein